MRCCVTPRGPGLAQPPERLSALPRVTQGRAGSGPQHHHLLILSMGQDHLQLSTGSPPSCQPCAPAGLAASLVALVSGPKHPPLQAPTFVPGPEPPSLKMPSRSQERGWPAWQSSSLGEPSQVRGQAESQVGVESGRVPCLSGDPLHGFSCSLWVCSPWPQLHPLPGWFP